MSASPLPPVRGGPDACPGTLALHPAADGHLARVRCPGGLLAAGQLTVLAAAARDLGDGHLELTSRANVQLRGVAADAAGVLAGRLSAAGLLPAPGHDRARNILGSPLAGVDSVPRWDVAAQVRALDAAICAQPQLTRLSGRFLFAVDDGRGATVAARPDVGLLPGSDGRVGIRLAGVDHGLRTTPTDAVRVAVAAARIFLADERAVAGTIWRIGDLAAAELARFVAALATTPGVHRVAADPPTAPRRSGVPPVGVLRRPDGDQALVLAVPLGQLTAAQADLLAAAAPQARITPWRTVVLPRLTDAPGWARRLHRAGLDTDPGSPWLGVTACAGRPGCARSRADVRADAAATHAGRPAAASGAHLPVHWIGCERGCGTPAGPALRVLATGDGYQVSAPGRPAVHVLPGAALAAAVRTAREEP
ncbi:precorrin-3B synthase [Solwaraspora sp. WMMA2080]|uniref:precorrin-3B synthase n=1 Tax=unclassified Solwaraspora TaxID=2627926 RepID=UPI00248B8271|nr:MULTISPECIES: precorrin-3B synthase [unclassified Solwaraspora]WBB99403.1 precorrin-3B synthase [Solwaraspora sp. WMMA2059]WBC22047.1 precorrin-3B synthase [Solwaraspora sp. WMMA2080]